MDQIETHGQMSSRKGQPKDKKERLKIYLQSLKLHPDVKEHRTIAMSFDVFDFKSIFKQDAIRRFVNATYLEPTTSATVEKLTGVKQKYLCELKRQLEKQGRIKVVYLGKCPTTGSKGVQFLSSQLSEPYKSNQLKSL